MPIVEWPAHVIVFKYGYAASVNQAPSRESEDAVRARDKESWLDLFAAEVKPALN